MPGVEYVMGTLGPLGESREPSLLPDAAEFPEPAGKKFMRVGLVAHIPDDGIAGRIENPMQGYGELYHPQVGRQMPSVRGYRREDEAADLLGKKPELAHTQFLDILGR